MNNPGKRRRPSKQAKSKRSLLPLVALIIAFITLLVAGYALKLQMVDYVEKQPAIGIWLEKVIFYGEYDTNMAPYIGFMVQIANVGGQPITLTPQSITGMYLPKRLPLNLITPPFKSVRIESGAQIVLRFYGIIEQDFTQRDKDEFDQRRKRGEIKKMFDHMILNFVTPSGIEYSSQDFMFPEPIVGSITNGPPVTICLAGAIHPNMRVKQIEDGDVKRIEWSVE